MKLKTGDKVVVIAGKDKGKEGNITKVLKNENKVVVEGINVAKKHVKPNGQTAGSIIDMELPIDASNVMYVYAGKPTRIGYKVENGTKQRVAKATGEVID